MNITTSFPHLTPPSKPFYPPLLLHLRNHRFISHNCCQDLISALSIAQPLSCLLHVYALLSLTFAVLSLIQSSNINFNHNKWLLVLLYKIHILHKGFLLNKLDVFKNNMDLSNWENIIYAQRILYIFWI